MLVHFFLWKVCPRTQAGIHLFRQFKRKNMSATAVFFKSSLVRKYWMALTGLFLCLFLIGHLAGNLQLVFLSGEEARLQFNIYAKFMTSNPAVKLLSYITYLSLLLHAIDGIVLTRRNRAARPVQYAYSNPGANSSWASRSMALLGILIMVFLIIHLKSFWFEMHFGSLPTDANGNKDLYEITVAAFQSWWYTALYVVAMAVLALHLSHGFQSAFQSLGLNHQKYTPLVKKVGIIFAILIPVLFAIIPIYLLIFN
jgi:succinate dehydrogenase / fumarate reductase cytochrome b subunit